MSVDVLLSGILGALLAVLVNMFYEQVAFRRRVAMEVSAWVEDVDALRNQLFAAREMLERALAKPHNKEMSRTWENRLNTIGDRLVSQVKSKACVVKVALAFGEGRVAETMAHLQHAISTLVVEEIEAIHTGDPKALESAGISGLRGAVDAIQEPLMMVLVRHGSLMEVVRTLGKGRPFDHGHRRSLPDIPQGTV